MAKYRVGKFRHHPQHWYASGPLGTYMFSSWIAAMEFVANANRNSR